MTTVKTQTLAEFLLARIAEDEEAAAEAGGDSWEVADPRKVRWVRNGGNAHGWAAFTELPTVTTHIARHDPDRVLRRCEADRRMAQDLAVMEAEDDAAKQDYAAWVDGHRAAQEPPRRTLDPALLPGLRRACQDLATVYAAHADYREEWRP